LKNESNTIEKELFLKNLEVSSLLEVTQAINNNIPEEELYKVFKFTIQSHVNIEKALLYVQQNEKWTLMVDINSKAIEELEIEKLLALINNNYKEPINISDGKFFEFLMPVKHKDKLLAFCLLKFRDNSAYKNTSFFNVLTNIIIVAIENKKMARERLKQEALKKELEIAKHVQQQLFPKNLPDNDLLKFHATYIPHDQIGGDYYDYIPINENEFIFCIADVSGKGIPAALLMSNFQASLRILALFETNLPELVIMLNKFVKLNANGEKFITLFVGKYNIKNRTLEYINAGHNLPFLYVNNEVIALEEGTTLLGVFDELPFLNSGKRILGSKSHLFLYTDGLSEIKNDSDIEIELDFIKDLVVETTDIKLIHRKIIDYIDKFKENQYYVDDISMFSLFFE
jgi:phosphoserine phosphatase RsbU/P